MEFSRAEIRLWSPLRTVFMNQHADVIGKFSHRKLAVTAKLAPRATVLDYGTTNNSPKSVKYSKHGSTYTTTMINTWWKFSKLFMFFLPFPRKRGVVAETKCIYTDKRCELYGVRKRSRAVHALLCYSIQCTHVTPTVGTDETALEINNALCNSV